jgi:hypothetical protein
MPYIKQADRDALERAERQPDNAGELNYVFTLFALEYMQRKGKKYQHINDVIGALEGAKLEFYRRFAAPYEDTKIAENGDVYGVEIVA